jgi:predicted nucleotidyltransferase
MGIIDPKDFSLSGALFSKVQQRVLALIFGHPERSFYTNQIVRAVRSGTGAVDRELSRLQQSGLVLVERIGNQKHYRANRQSPIFDEIRGIVRKTFGLVDPLRQSLEPHAHKIDAAFVYGSVAKGTDTASSDIDLMIVGEDLTYTDLFAGLEEAEKILGRPVNPNFLSREEWRRKIREKNSFIAKLAGSSKIFVFGSEDDLKA